ncbi:MAG: hypothetical protein J1F35_06990 [Erysipelotrichales bacterium]|nr:hypothetical protein [Erysipelotrichales bacterium]
MKKLKDFIVENKIFLIVGTIIVGLCCFLYIYHNRKLGIEYKPGNPTDVEYIQNTYEENQYSPVTIELIDLLNEYYSYYIKYQVKDADKAYELLTDETKESFNNDIEEYKKYINKINTIKTINNQVEKYRLVNKNEHVIEIVDSEGYKFTIYENSVWDFKISLDGKE